MGWKLGDPGASLRRVANGTAVRIGRVSGAWALLDQVSSQSADQPVDGHEHWLGRDRVAAAVGSADADEPSAQYDGNWEPAAVVEAAALTRSDRIRAHGSTGPGDRAAWGRRAPCRFGRGARRLTTPLGAA